MAGQFSIQRMLGLVAIVAAGSALFATVKWPIALLALGGLNAVAYVWFGLIRKSRFGEWAALTALLILATLLLTDWGVSRPNGQVRVAWWCLTSACVAQGVTLIAWLLAPLLRGAVGEGNRHRARSRLIALDHEIQ